MTDPKSRAVVLRRTDGREVNLGSENEVSRAFRQITQTTGGSSGQGAWSHVFGLHPDQPYDADEAVRLRDEAVDMLQRLEAALDGDAIRLLRVLATL